MQGSIDRDNPFHYMLLQNPGLEVFSKNFLQNSIEKSLFSCMTVKEYALRKGYFVIFQSKNTISVVLKSKNKVSIVALQSENKVSIVVFQSENKFSFVVFQSKNEFSVALQSKNSFFCCDTYKE